MPLMKTLATSLAGRRVATAVGRRIPNPLVRFAVITAATTLAPYVTRRVQAAWQRRQIERAASRRSPLALTR